jgi:hypothetical protein
VGGQRHAPVAFPPVKKTGTHCTEAGWAPRPVKTGADNLLPTGFDLRFVQPVANHCTDSAILVHTPRNVRTGCGTHPASSSVDSGIRTGAPNGRLSSVHNEWNITTTLFERLHDVDSSTDGAM